MKLLKRILGICETLPPKDSGCWRIEAGTVIFDLSRAPELKASGSAVRLEGKGLPERLLIIHGADGRFHAYKNRCTHMGRRIDPQPGSEDLQCCSVSKSTYNYGGVVLSGPAGGPLTVFPVDLRAEKLVVSLKEPD